MLVISIDGACRRNGKANCISAGGVFIAHYSDELEIERTEVHTACEVFSTNQRGEMLALHQALEWSLFFKQPVQIVTDSEYLFNTMTKGWCVNWANKGWITSAGNPVKNKGLWEDIMEVYEKCLQADIDIVFYHVKGHVIPFGKVTAEKLLDQDPTGFSLYKAVKQRYRSNAITGEALDRLTSLSEKNNGFAPSPEVLERFVVANVVVDAIATRGVEVADLRYSINQ